MHPSLRTAMAVPVIIVLAACATAPDSATGQMPGARANTVVASNAPEGGNKDDPLVCITEQLTGSRVHSRRVCKLSSTWAREEHLAKELGTQIQNQGSLNPLREP